MTEATVINRPATAAAPASPLLSVSNIEVVYDKVILVLRGLSLEVPKGAIVALLGANGAGKSTTLMARPKMILMDEPSMGLSPLLVKEVFAIIKEINRDLGVTILLVEQNARAALSVASHGYIMEQGKVVLDGTAGELRDNEDVKEFYLGGAGDQRKSFKNLKSFKRRKRWL